MRANGKNTVLWLSALTASLLIGCATDDSTDQDGLREGTYAVTGYELGSCANDAWLQSATKTSAIFVGASGDGYVVKACTDGKCTPSSPSTYSWNTDAWRGTDGGAYLVDTGCLLTYVDATVHPDGDKLVIEATRWSANLAGGACTFDEVMAMRQTPCADRVRLIATAQ